MVELEQTYTPSPPNDYCVLAMTSYMQCLRIQRSCLKSTNIIQNFESFGEYVIFILDQLSNRLSKTYHHQTRVILLFFIHFKDTRVRKHNT